MRALGLDDSYGAYVDRVPGITLAVGNAASMFGLHRRHRAALLGHLAAFEMTSSLPNSDYSQELRRLGADAPARRFYDEHVQADAVHEPVAANDMCGGFGRRVPHRDRRHPLRRRLRPGPRPALRRTPDGPMERRDVVAAHSLSGRETRVMDLDYVLPLRWEDDAGLAELTAYLHWLSGHARVIVVDGSPPRLFAGHAGAWRGLVRHLPPEGDTANGKVAAVVTGLCEARGEQVVIADDVRHDLRSLARITALLETADLVRPQNHFFPLPWHAWWDTPAPC